MMITIMKMMTMMMMMMTMLRCHWMQISEAAKASSTLRVHQCALHNQLLCWDTKYNVVLQYKKNTK